MTRAIIIPFHAYTPFGIIYYQPILDFQLQTLRKYKDEFDTLYLIEDDNWILPKQEEDWIKIIHVNSSKRYYDAYKEVLPQVEEDLVLLLDDDFLIYKEGIINHAFFFLHPIEDILPRGFDVVSITDTIGTMQVSLKTGNKLCPYFFAARKDLLMKYLDIDWGPDAMPYTETFGLLTEALLKDGTIVHEMEDDKSNILLNSTDLGTLIEYDTNNEKMKSKDLGWYHIRAGSTPAYLLATEKYGNMDTYNHYLLNQPKSEILRQCAWYLYMRGNPDRIVEDLGINEGEWMAYYEDFLDYHNLP